MARDELAALHARLESLAGRDDLAAVHERLDGLAARDELAALAGRDEVAELRDRLDGLAARDELAALRERLDGLAAHDRGDELAAVRAQLDGFARNEDLATLAGRDEVDALRERLGELGGLRRRVDEALERIAQVDRGAGSVLADVRAISGQVTAAEQEALGARQVAVVAGEAANAAREDAARAAEEAAATRRDVEAHAARTALLSDQSPARAATRPPRGRPPTGSTHGSPRSTSAPRRCAANWTRSATRSTGSAGPWSIPASALKSEIGGVRDGLDALRSELVTLREEAKRGDDRIEAMQSELTFALKSLEELKQGLSSAGQAAVIARREAEQARKAASTSATARPSASPRSSSRSSAWPPQRNAAARRPQRRHAGHDPPEPVKREPRHGFDDAHAPMAILALDGKFKELNPAFTKLVGYKEHEFMKAAWPSPHDRKRLQGPARAAAPARRRRAAQVEVTSTYMHGQGLMVPVVGSSDARDGRGRRCRCTSCSRPKTATRGNSVGRAALALPTGRCP